MFTAISALFRFLVLFSCIVSLAAQTGPSNWTASPFNPPSLPLAVRSPYLNTWRPQGNLPQGVNIAPQFLWDASTPFAHGNRWFALVVVDGAAYRIMGDGDMANLSVANQTAVEFTPTRTTFLLTAGPMNVNVSFISPIEPLDLVRQSLPFSYLSISVSSNDGNAYPLRVYSDVTGEFMAGGTSQQSPAQWMADEDDQYVVLSTELVAQQQYSENQNRAEDATEYYAFKKIDGATTSWAIANHLLNHENAANANTTLGKTIESATTQVYNGTTWPTLGIAVDWESVSSTPEPVIWALGVVRSPSIQYRTTSGSTQDRYPYFISTYENATTAAKFFLDDFSRAQSASASFDAQLIAAGQQYSENYADLLALTARQAMGAMDITISKDSSGAWNMSDVKVFMKNMGGAGTDGSVTSMSVNTVDTLYAAFPMFLYLNPELGGYLLSPLLEYQGSSKYFLGYAARNIGTSYPNATADGINEEHDFGIEESANMLIMTLAYSQRSGNGTFLSQHYTLLRKWAEYLGNNTTNQKSADFIALMNTSNNNQTNLALKGIIGIASMAEIARVAGASDDQSRFNSTAISYISQWQNNTVASDRSHLDAFYGQDDSFGLIYNLYADKLLQLNLVTEAVFEVATVGYNALSGQTKYGISLENDQAKITTTNGMMFAASVVTNTTIRDSMMSQIHSYASSNQNNTPFSSVYDPTAGIPVSDTNAGQNSPNSGAVFSLLALNTTINMSISIPKDGSTIPNGPASLNNSKKSKTNVSAIAGGVVGGIVILVIIPFGCLRYFQKLRIKQGNAAIPQPFCSDTTQSPALTSVYRGMPVSVENNFDGRKGQKEQHDTAYGITGSDAPTHILASAIQGSGSAGDEVINPDPELLREENDYLRQELQYLRQNNLPPSYSDPGISL